MRTSWRFNEAGANLTPQPPLRLRRGGVRARACERRWSLAALEFCLAGLARVVVRAVDGLSGDDCFDLEELRDAVADAFEPVAAVARYEDAFVLAALGDQLVVVAVEAHAAAEHHP